MQEKFHAGRMTNHIQGPKKTDGGQRELAVGGGNGEAMGGEALWDGVCSHGTHRSQAITWRKEAAGRLEIYRKEALKVLKIFLAINMACVCACFRECRNTSEINCALV